LHLHPTEHRRVWGKTKAASELRPITYGESIIPAGYTEADSVSLFEVKLAENLGLTGSTHEETGSYFDLVFDATYETGPVGEVDLDLCTIHSIPIELQILNGLANHIRAIDRVITRYQ
jgi:hypothetical protein